jgi:hypothetical protein
MLVGLLVVITLRFAEYVSTGGVVRQSESARGFGLYCNV